MINGRVLLLNQDFQVLGTIGVARAIRMTLRKENPIMVHEYVPDRYLTSGNGDKYPVPSVISLRHYVNIRGNRAESGAKRSKIYLRDGFACGYCGIKAVLNPNKKQIRIKDLTMDHIIPRSKGGNNLATNLVTACRPCNTRKADRNPEDARMPLRTEIHDVTKVGADNIALCRYVEYNPVWISYLQSKEGFLETYEKYQAILI